MELRHPRRNQQPQPPQPQPIRATPSTHTANSSTSTSSSLSQSATSLSSSFQLQTNMLQAQQPSAGIPMSAPLPSPSAVQPMSYFGSFPPSQQGPPPPTSHPTQQQSTPQPQANERFLGQRGNGGGLPETAPFLKDFNLVAEAAKRAQMACLTRDMGDVGL